MTSRFSKRIVNLLLYAVMSLLAPSFLADTADDSKHHENEIDPYQCIATQNHKLSSLCIDEKLLRLKQDDPHLIKVIRENYVYPPSTLPYNFSIQYSSHDDELLDGQFQQATFIERKYFKVKAYRSKKITKYNKCVIILYSITHYHAIIANLFQKFIIGK